MAQKHTSYQWHMLWNSKGTKTHNLPMAYAVKQYWPKNTHPTNGICCETVMAQKHTSYQWHTPCSQSLAPAQGSGLTGWQRVPDGSHQVQTPALPKGLFHVWPSGSPLCNQLVSTGERQHKVCGHLWDLCVSCLKSAHKNESALQFVCLSMWCLLNTGDIQQWKYNPIMSSFY